MINNNNESIIDNTVVKAMVGAIRNPFDKKICANCKNCGAKGDMKFYCGYGRTQVSSDGSCNHFKEKL